MKEQMWRLAAVPAAIGYALAATAAQAQPETEAIATTEYVLEYISQVWSGAPLGNYSSPAWGRRWGVQLRWDF